jgi:hypothetical protein
VSPLVLGRQNKFLESGAYHVKQIIESAFLTLNILTKVAYLYLSTELCAGRGHLVINHVKSFRLITDHCFAVPVISRTGRSGRTRSLNSDTLH